jgi:hypothetical protein
MSSTDPHYDNVVLLLPMNGPDNGTTFFDRSKTPKTITNTSNYVKTRTEQFKFYDSCGWFGYSANAQLELAASADFNFAMGDFTLDGWFKTTQAKANIGLIAKNNTSESFVLNGQWHLELNSTTSAGDILFRVREGDSTQTLLSGGSGLLDDTWHHFELNRHGEDWGLYIDGTLVDDATYAGGISNLSHKVLVGGHSYGGWSMMGYMQDVHHQRRGPPYRQVHPPHPWCLCTEVHPGHYQGRYRHPLRAHCPCLPERYRGPCGPGTL